MGMCGGMLGECCGNVLGNVWGWECVHSPYGGVIPGTGTYAPIVGMWNVIFLNRNWLMYADTAADPALLLKCVQATNNDL